MCRLDPARAVDTLGLRGLCLGDFLGFLIGVDLHVWVIFNQGIFNIAIGAPLTGALPPRFRGDRSADGFGCGVTLRTEK